VQVKLSGDSFVYYEEAGTGPAVLLLHGAASSLRSFDALTPRLAERFRTISLDFRGTGRSSRVTKVTPTMWCDDVIALLDDLGIDQIHLIGRSLGARVAGLLALDRRDRVASLTVDAPMLGVSESADAALNDRFTKPPSDPTQANRWRWLHGVDWQEKVAFYGQARQDQALQQYLTIRPRLAELTLPTLITRGDKNDAVHPLDHAIEWHHAHPKSQLWIAPDCRFAATLDRPAEFADIFAKFVDASFN
jgi:pimeloyl-ACP methyl ester carboxylesterase